jgi:hypothetical protein
MNSGTATEEVKTEQEEAYIAYVKEGSPVQHIEIGEKDTPDGKAISFMRFSAQPVTENMQTRFSNRVKGLVCSLTPTEVENINKSIAAKRAVWLNVQHAVGSVYEYDNVMLKGIPKNLIEPLSKYLLLAKISTLSKDPFWQQNLGRE